MSVLLHSVLGAVGAVVVMGGAIGGVMAHEERAAPAAVTKPASANRPAAARPSAPVAPRTKATAQAAPSATAPGAAGNGLSLPAAPEPGENGPVPRPADKTTAPRGVDESGTVPRPEDTGGELRREMTDTPLGPPPVEGRRDLDQPPPQGSGSGGVDIHRRPKAPDRPAAAPPARGAGQSKTPAPAVPADQRVVTPPGSAQPHQPASGPLPGSAAPSPRRM